MISYDENKKLTVINLFGGPGIGKSTLAAGLFHTMKVRGMSVELVTEVAKDLIWEGRRTMLTEQDHVFSEQNKRLRRLVGQVEYAVVDSPLLMGIAYCRDFFPKTFFPYVVETVRTYNNINILLTRTFKYDQVGREQTEEGAIEKDNIIKHLLHTYDIDHHELVSDSTTCSKILEHVAQCK